MWLAVRGLDFARIASYFARANYFWVALSTVFGLLAYWFRAVRWNLLLQPMGYSISNKNALWTLSFGYLMNLTIPRSGEVARATALYSVEKVPVDKSFGTIVLERVVDLLFMGIFLCLTVIYKSEAIEAFYRHATDSGQDDQSKPSWLWLIAATAIVGTILFFLLRKRLERLTFFGKLYAVADGLWQGITSIFRLKKPVRFVLLSAGIWLCYYTSAYLVCFSLSETAGFSLADGLFIIVVGTLGMMVPASGGIGAFHYALKIGIGALFVSLGRSFNDGAEAGLAYAFISHTMQLVIMAVMGCISIPMLAKARR